MMRWWLFAVALLVTFVVQTTARPLVAWSWLDLLLGLALVCGLTAPTPEARLAAFFVGLAQGIGTGGPLGVHALALGLAGLLLTYLREQVNRHLWWVRWLIASAAAGPGQFLVLLHQRFLQGDAHSWRQMAVGGLVTSVVAGLLAAVAVGLPAAYRRRRHRHAAFRW
jgi:rod shape-determining protein MreD